MNSLQTLKQLLYKSTPFTGGTNSCFLNPSPMLNALGTNTNRWFLNQCPMLEVQTVELPSYRCR